MTSVSTVNVSRWKAHIMGKEAKIKRCYFKGLKLEYGYESEYSINKQIDADTDYYKYANHKSYFFDQSNNNNPT